MKLTWVLAAIFSTELVSLAFAQEGSEPLAFFKVHDNFDTSGIPGKKIFNSVVNTVLNEKKPMALEHCKGCLLVFLSWA